MTQILDRYREAFQEEVSEILGALESSLLDLEKQPDEPELVARVFRALHTIKGSGAMFGFDAMASFAHQLETVFDEVRGGRVAVTPALIRVTLDARDYLQNLLRAANGEEPQQPAIVAAAILDRLHRAAGGDDRREPMAAASDAPPPAEAQVLGPSRVYRIRFDPHRDIFLNGTNPIGPLKELAAIGDLKLVAYLDRIPELAEFNPEDSYTYWDAELTTAAGEEAVRDAFIFVEDLAAVTVECVSNTDEQAPAAGPRQAAAAATLRVPAAKLDSLVDIVGELVTVQARLSGYALASADQEVNFIAEEVERLAELLRESAMALRMLPIGETFSRFKRLVHDLSAELGKQAELVTEGNDTELDKTVIEQLSEPLVHLIRNAIDHGIESPEQRRALDKPPAGKIQLSACHSGAFVLIRVSDDGAGMSRVAIRARALERGIIGSDAVLTDEEVYALTLLPGFSTADRVTEVSGRGVGMDVVQRSMELLRGTLAISSRPGAGTVVTLKIPLTLAIVDGLLVEAGGSFFVVPLSDVSGCIELERAGAAHAGKQSLVSVRGELVPYVALRERFSLPGAPPPIEQIIVAETRDGKCGFVVDRVIGDHHTVIKKLGHLYRGVEEVSGATILGDGTVALILDVEKIALAAVREARCR